MKSKLAQFSVFLFILYLFWYKYVFGQSSKFLYGGALLVMGTTMLYMNKKSYNRFGIPLGTKWHIAYGIYSLLFGFFIVEYKFYMITSLITYFAFLAVVICICYICEGTNDTSWLMSEIAAVALLCAFWTIFKGYDYRNGVMVKTLGADNNPNTLGLVLIMGIFAIMMLNSRKFAGMIISLGLMGVLSYGIVLTGSKKSLFGAGILLAIWMISFIRDSSKSGKIFRIMLSYILVAGIITAAVMYFNTSYKNTASFQRMQGLFDSGSTLTRAAMYRRAFELFEQNPLFGIGYDHFRIVSGFGTYSHSTYVEVLSSGGIMGSFIFFVPLLATGIALLKKALLQRSYIYGVLVSLYFVEMFLGAVNIFMYGFSHLLLWGILFMFADKRNLAERKIGIEKA